MQEKVLATSTVSNWTELETVFAVIVEGEAFVITPEGNRLKLTVGNIVGFTRVKPQSQ